MKTNALILAHYDFKNDKGQEIKTSKLRVNLGDYGYLELCSDLANDYPLLAIVNVLIEYDDKKRRYKVTQLSD